MTYLVNIPKSAVSPAASVSPMKGNFTQFNTVFSINHTAMNDTNQGKHEVVLCQLQDKDPTVSGNWPTLYERNTSTKAGTQLALFYKIPKFLAEGVVGSGISNKSIQMTYNQVVTTATNPSATNPFQSFLFGGYLIYFNQTLMTSQNTTVTLSPAPTKILSVLAYPMVNDSALKGNSTTILSNKTFSITGTSGINYQWIAICED